MKILVIEDNPRLAEKVQNLLQKWFIVEVAGSGDAGLMLLSLAEFDCVLLDLGLPDAPGQEICYRIRALNQHVPILVVTATDTVESRVDLLEAGADDYITKPFNSAELQARINALIRRRHRQDNVALIRIGDLVINPNNRTVTRAGLSIKLRKKEFDILEYLALNHGRVVPRSAIINHAWASTSKSWVGSVDVHIKQLRDKVDKPFGSQLIKTIYGVGYMVEVPNDLTKEREQTT